MTMSASRFGPEDEERPTGIKPSHLQPQIIAQIFADLTRPLSGCEADLAHHLVQFGETISADRGLIIQLQGKDQGWQISWSKAENWHSQPAQFPDRGLLHQCIQTRQLQLETEHFLEDQSVPAIKTSRICAPLLVDQQLLGVVQLEWDYAEVFEGTPAVILAWAQALAQNISTRATFDKQTEEIRTLEIRRQELFHSRNTLRALFDSTPSAIYIIDQQFTLKAINMSRANQAHRSPQALVGEPCYQGLYRLDHPCPDCLISRTFTTGEITRRIEHPVTEEEGWREIAISTYPIHDESRRVVQAFIFEEDLTQQRQLENFLVQAEKLAAVGRMAAGVAHEINNPLTAVIANAQLLQRKLPNDDTDLQEMAALILLAGNRASQAVSNLLDLARRERYELVPVDVNKTIRNALDLVRHEIQSKSIQVKFHGQENLPQVMASEEQLEGVWINLLINAVDAIDHDHGVILLSSRMIDSAIQVYVEDNGEGISEEDLSHIFEPFYTTKEQGHGTGLGLSICHRVVEQLGGKITVQSVPENGTRFIVVLPVD